MGSAHRPLVEWTGVTCELSIQAVLQRRLEVGRDALQDERRYSACEDRCLNIYRAKERAERTVAVSVIDLVKHSLTVLTSAGLLSLP
jgi:hypothetical protein